MFGQAIERLYEAFAEVPRPAAIEGCPCCVDPGEDRPLLSQAVRSLTATDLAKFGTKAMTTWGGPEDFRYFAPRLLELAADDDFGWPDVEIVFTKLGTARWWEWAQCDTVMGFLAAFWSRTLSLFPSRPAVGTALCALAGAATDMAPYLDEWGRLSSEAAISHPRELATEELSWRRGHPRLLNAFWDTTSVPYEQVVTWLTEGPAHDAISAAFDRTDDETLLELLAETEQLLRP